MSESYTIGGDTLILVENQKRSGQSFLVMEDHVLQFIDLELQGPLIWPEPVILVYMADWLGHPFGDYLSRNRYIVEKQGGAFAPRRVRFSMQPVLLHKGDSYVIIAENYPSLPPSRLWWQYDKDDATYPRGHRISSTDGGATWTDHWDDDHMFVEFGDPPAPEPPPDPPIPNFAVLDLIQKPILDGIQISLPTNVPCHLICYWTDKKPLKHPTSRILRGLAVPWGTYFCFVGWKAVEQIEPGDTLYHTFILTPWQYCQTRWLTFRGNIDETLSPSIGPIFEKHRIWLPLTKYEYYDAAFNTGLGTSSTVKLAQTFTPQTTHLIGQVVLLLRRRGLPGEMTLEIQGTLPDGRPDDIPLTSTIFDADTLPTGPPPAAIWLTIPLDPPQLAAGTKYAIVVYGGDNDNKILWNAHTADPYPRGRAWYWRPAPWYWRTAFGYDFLFEEWGYGT